MLIAYPGCFLIKACSSTCSSPHPPSVFPATCLKQLHMGEHPWWRRRGRRHLSLRASRQHVTEPLSPGNSLNPVVMFRSPPLLYGMNKYLIFISLRAALSGPSPKPDLAAVLPFNAPKHLMHVRRATVEQRSSELQQVFIRALPNWAVTLALCCIGQCQASVQKSDVEPGFICILESENGD